MINSNLLYPHIIGKFWMGRHAEVTVQLRKDRAKLKKLISSGVESVRVIKRAQVLLLFDKNIGSPKISQFIGVTPETARRIAHRYHSGGLKHALYESPRFGHKPILDEKRGSRIIAMVCSDPPAGRERWSLSLIKEEAVRRGLVKKVGAETIRVLLHRHDIKPWRKKNVVRAELNGGIR